MSRRVRQAEFLVAAHTLQQIPRPGAPEIAFAGRSNVGKSSLLNALAGRKRLALVSQTPGKTRSINFFTINGDVLWVDLPGYGYAKVSRTLQAEWGRLVTQYLEARPSLVRVICLSDSRRPPTAQDVQLVEWLEDNGVAWLGLLTKADKLNQSKRAKAVRQARDAYACDAAHPLLLCSATTGRGLDALWPHVLPADEHAPNSRRAS